MIRIVEARAWPWHNPVMADVFVAMLVVLLGVVPVVVGPEGDPNLQFTTWMLPLLVLGAAMLVLRRRYAVAVWAATTCVGLVAAIVERGPSPAHLPAIVALYALATTSPLPTTLVAAFVTALVPRAVMGLQGTTVVDAAVYGLTAWCGVAAATGVAVQKQRAVVVEARERARQAEATREEEVQRSVAEERLRIARELHDVVAHHVAVINVQAGVAAHLMELDQDKASEALTHVREASQIVLREVPGLLGLLRDADEIERSPSPRLADSGQLVEAARRSGLDVKWRIAGSPRELGPSVELTAFRVLQEALTNAARHGSGSGRAVAKLTYDTAGCSIEVRNERPRRSEALGSERHGLVGMRERVAAVGGDLTVGPEGDRDWVVRVHLPSPEEKVS